MTIHTDIRAFQVRPSDIIANDGMVQSVLVLVERDDMGAYSLGEVALFSTDGRTAMVPADEVIPVTGLCPFLHEYSEN